MPAIGGETAIIAQITVKADIEERPQEEGFVEELEAGHGLEIYGAHRAGLVSAKCFLASHIPIAEMATNMGAEIGPALIRNEKRNYCEEKQPHR